MNIIPALLSALGLSTAAGLNAYIPLLVIGLLARYTNLIELTGPYAVLSNPLFLLAVAVLCLLDLIGDKIPTVDHVLHLAGLVIAPVAGAIVALAATNAFGGVDPVFAAICGLLAAGGGQAVRTAARPVSTATTAGLANPVISFIEDGISLVLSLLAVIVPVIAGLAVLAFVAVVVYAVWRWRRRARAPVSR